MTRDEARKNAALLLAYADGAEIQARDGAHWDDLAEPDFVWGAAEYRVKPEPRECWRAAYNDGEGFRTCYAYRTREKCAEDCGPVAHPVRFVETEDE